MSDDLGRDLNKNEIQLLFSKLKDLELDEHYDFDGVINTTLTNASLVADFLKSNKPIIFEVGDSNTLYYKLSGVNDADVFMIDVENSFVKSDAWLYDKLISVPSVFPSLMEGKISNEMTSFYTGLVISSVFGDVFEEEFIEVSDNYNFSTWTPNTGEFTSFTDLLTSWIQLGSKYIKMVASAAKYSLVREKQKKRVPSALLLPQDVVLEFKKACRDVDEIRYKYDSLLDVSSRAKMSKLQIRITIAERDLKIQKRIEENSKIYQVWRLMNMNSGVIPPTILLRINRESKKNALELYRSIRACSGVPTSRDDLIAVKVLEDKCKRIVKRAYLNKLFAKEAIKFNNDPDKYVAPSFM